MQEKGVGTQAYLEVEIGRESEDMCLLARVFNGFANSTRLSILLLLAQRGEMRVGELVHELGAPQPRVSDHLRCLAWCGYVEATHTTPWPTIGSWRYCAWAKRCSETTSSTSSPARPSRKAARSS